MVMRGKQFILILVVLLLGQFFSARAEEYSIRFYDDQDGLSHWHVSQILQDTTGMMWVATWNGLNRFDGSRFVAFKPTENAALCIPHDRIRRFRLTKENNLECLIENRVYLFNTRNCYFDTLSREKEQEAYERLKQRFNPDFDRPSMAKVKQFGSVALQNIWEEYRDKQGNKWLYDDHGIFVATTLPSRGMPVDTKEARSLYRMRNGDIWASVRDLRQVMVYDSTLTLLGYLNSNGRIQSQPISFGQMVYCMHETRSGNVLLGCKPGCVMEKDGSKWHSYPELRNAYDIEEDPDGRLWVATFGFGLWRETGTRQFELVKGTENLFIRRLVILGDGTLLGATTSGVLVIEDARSDSPRVHVHKRDGDSPSLQSNAVMCLCYFNGTLYVGTEGGGLNVLQSNLHDARWVFERLTPREGLGDIVFELMPWSNEELLIQSSSSFSILNTSSRTLINYDRRFFGGNRDYRLVLGEVPPVALNDSEVLIAPTTGLFLLNKHALKPDKEVIRIALCSIRRNGENDFAVDYTDHVSLGPNERNLVMSFAALDYRNNGELLYSTRMYEKGKKATSWGLATATNEIIIQDLHPGDYIFEIRSTNAYGQLQDNVRPIHITVQPTFMESTVGKALLGSLAMLITLLITIAYLQVRFSREKRAETLAAYLELQERFSQIEQQRDEKTPLPIPEILAPGYTSENERFLNTLHRFMDEHISDSEMNMDDLAKEVNMSRSTLNRKMHELFNLSAKDFVQAARIKHACGLLATTQMAMKEVAYACGFSDPNYFSKSFKSNTGQTPKEYREKCNN